MPDVKRVVLAYSGGLDTSVILRWLIETYKCEVVAYCADLGQGEELIPIRDKALKPGAVGVHVVDLRETFVRDFIFPMLRANAVYEGAYLLGTSIARPLIAQAQVEIALGERADAVAHGATGKGNDQVRFELTYAALAPQLTVIAPWREWDLNSRSALMDFARRHDIPVPVTAERPYSPDRNLFHISYEGGIPEDPWTAPPDKMFQLTNSPEAAPAVPLETLSDSEAGNPAAADGALLPPGAPRARRALPDGLRALRGRRRLPPARRRGLHQPERPAPEDPRSARPPELTGCASMSPSRPTGRGRCRSRASPSSSSTSSGRARASSPPSSTAAKRSSPWPPPRGGISGPPPCPPAPWSSPASVAESRLPASTWATHRSTSPSSG